MKKFITSLLLILSLAFPSFAAENIQYTVEQNTLDVLIQNQPNQPVTITISDSNRKYYIDQGKTDSNGQIHFQIPLKENKTYKSSINTGGQIESKEITIGNPTPDTDSSKQQTADIYIRGIQGTILSRTSIEIKEEDTVLDVLKRTMDNQNIDYVIESGGYIKSINGESAGQYGALSGWLYRINGDYDTYSNMGSIDAEVKDGDFIEWRYTKDGGFDIGWETNPDQYGDSSGKSDENQITKDIEQILTNPDMSAEQLEKTLEDLLSKFNEDPVISSTPESQEKITALAKKIIETYSTIKIPATEIQSLKDSPSFKLDKDMLLTAADNVLEKAIEVEEKLKNEGIIHSLQKQLNIEIPLSEKQEINTIIPPKTLDSILKKGLDNIYLKTDIAAFKIDQDTFDKVENEIQFCIKKADVSQIPIPYKEHFLIDIECLSDNKESIRFQKPIQVNIPYEGNTENPQKVGAFRLKDNQELEAIGGVYDNESRTVTFLTEHFSKYLAREWEKTFKDLDKNHWAKESVEIMASKGIISGRNEKCFDPDAPITRAEFAALITKMLRYNSQSKKVLNFEDVKSNAWYYSVVQAAYEKWLMKGISDTQFNPEEKISRQEIAVVLNNILEKKGLSEKVDHSVLDKFADQKQIAPWAQDSVALLVQKNLIKGMQEDIFAPCQYATRAQTAVLLEKIYPWIFK